MSKYFESVRNTDGPEKNFKPLEKWRIWRNVFVLGFAFMIHFTAFWGASNLQSSVNADESLGTFTLAAIYGSLILSNIFLPTIVIKWFGCKWAIAISLLTYVPFIASQFHPKFYTMIPAGLFVGFGGGPLWCAKCTYLSVVAEAYSQITSVHSELIVTRFFGVFFMFYQFSQVWGNLISSAVLSSGRSIVSNNSTLVSASAGLKELGNLSVTLKEIGEKCGVNFHPGAATTENPNLEPPPAHKIQLISGIYLACMIIACLCIVFGSYVSCGWGISNIGFVMICFGVVNAIAAIFTGGISKKIGRAPMIAFAFLLHIGLLITLLKWKPYSDNKALFFVIAGLWGLCDAVWLVQINALCGILFPGKEEAAYSNFRLWESTGSVITYAYSPYLQTNIKIYLLIALLIIGVSGYTIIDVTEYKTKRRTLNTAKANYEFVTGKVKSLEIDS
ncbi:hypothetical protein FQA39_LY01252 [Lamprigera yunnana]|nr:hypothetical protein FQA39_LY01252 [Lamprigera yunnana]